MPITITITGTNDVPVITSGPQTIAFAGGTSVPGGDLTAHVADLGHDRVRRSRSHRHPYGFAGADQHDDCPEPADDRASRCRPARCDI